MIHVSQWTAPKNPFLAVVADNGALGVQLFFIASALTIFLSLNSRQSKESSPTRNFFIRRFFRIAPMFYLAILVFTIMARPSASTGISWWFIPLTAAFLHGWLPDTINSVVPGGWSIAVEFTFYLITPLLFRWIKNIRSALLFIALSIPLGWSLTRLAASFFITFYPEKYYFVVYTFTQQWFFTNLPVFAVGILTYLLFQKYKDLQDRRLGYTLLALAVILMVAFLSVSTYEDLLTRYFLSAVAFSFLTFGLYFSNSGVLLNPAIQWIGKLSFSMYLVHFLVLKIITPFFPQGILRGGNKGFLLAFGMVLVVTVAFSLITYFVIEKNGIALGKRVIQNLEMKHSPAKVESGPIS
jgi:peptidoglycan/LPS O-acetylase OafA/YrhL